MKIGDTVKIHDFSWNGIIKDDGTLGHRNLTNSNWNVLYKVIATNCILPLYGKSFYHTNNDTIIQDIHTKEVLFVKASLLTAIQHEITFNGVVFIIDNDIHNEIAELL